MALIYLRQTRRDSLELPDLLVLIAIKVKIKRLTFIKGNEQSRRDDMEAIGYVLVYLAKGELPWMNL